MVLVPITFGDAVEALPAEIAEGQVLARPKFSMCADYNHGIPYPTAQSQFSRLWPVLTMQIQPPLTNMCDNTTIRSDGESKYHRQPGERMPCPKPTPLSTLTVADLKALLAEKEIEVLKERQAELEGDLRRVEKELARLVKGPGAASHAPKRPAKRATAKPTTKKAGKRKAATTAKAAPRPTNESLILTVLKSSGKPMTVPQIVATIMKRKLVKTDAANFAGSLRQTIAKSSKIKKVGRGVYRA